MVTLVTTAMREPRLGWKKTNNNASVKRCEWFPEESRCARHQRGHRAYRNLWKPERYDCIAQDHGRHRRTVVRQSGPPPLRFCRALSSLALGPEVGERACRFAVAGQIDHAEGDAARCRAWRAGDCGWRGKSTSRIVPTTFSRKLGLAVVKSVILHLALVNWRATANPWLLSLVPAPAACSPLPKGHSGWCQFASTCIQTLGWPTTRLGKGKGAWVSVC
jgi:hypothetical protein